MIDKIINNIVWWIPIKKLRNSIREYLNIIYKELIKKNDKFTEKTYIILSSAFFNLKSFMINNPDKFNDCLYNFSKNLDEYSIETLNSYIHKHNCLINKELSIHNFYKIPIESSFFTDEEKITYLNKKDIIFELSKKYKTKYNILDFDFSLQVFYYKYGLLYIPDILKNNLKNSIALDLGGGKGETSIMLLEEFKFSKIYTYEPSQQLFNTLNNNIKKYNLQDKIKIFKQAVGDVNDYINFFEDANAGFGSFVSTKFNNSTKIQSIRLDDNLEVLDNIKLIKLDIEGFEYQALKGAENIVRRNSPILLISCYHNNNFNDNSVIPQMFVLKDYIESLNMGYKILYRHIEPNTLYEYLLICYK